MAVGKCVWCGLKPRDSKIGEVCSERCFDARMRLKKSQKLDRNGYMRNSQGQLIHRLTCEKAYGKIPKDWVVHHIDGDKLNNKAINLIALPQYVHDELHGQGLLPNRHTCNELIKRWYSEMKSIENSIKALHKCLKASEELLASYLNKPFKKAFNKYVNKRDWR